MSPFVADHPCGGPLTMLPADRVRAVGKSPPDAREAPSRGGLADAGGRYRTRTDDLLGVNEALYQLSQSPVDRPAANEGHPWVTSRKDATHNALRFRTRAAESALW